MLLACTTAYNQDKSVETSQFSDGELQQITSVAGECVLVSLEKRLTPAELEKCTGSLEYSQALFLILLGTILAVGYMEPIQDTPNLANASHIDPTLSIPLYQSVQEHLCATLAHYMIYLGHKTTITFDPPTQEHLITKAHERWQAQGHFQWMTPVPFRGRSGDSDSKCTRTSNSSEERSTRLGDSEVWNDALEEFGQQERAGLFIHDYVRGCSSSPPFPTDVEGIIEDHHLPPPVWTQDTFAESASTGVVYHPAIAVLPDHNVGHIPKTYVYDIPKNTGGPGSESTQFSSPEIISNLTEDIMIDSSVGLSSTSIRQSAVEKSGNLVERLDMQSGEMQCWTTATLDSFAAWKGAFSLDRKKVMRKRPPFSPEKHESAHALRKRNWWCDRCLETNNKPFPNLNANNDLFRSHIGIAMIELEQRSNLVYCHPGTAFHTNELCSDSGERLTARNTTFGPGSTWKGSSQTLRQYLAKEPFTTEEVQAPSRNLLLHEQHSHTDGFSEDLTMLIGEEGANRLMQESNLLDVTICGDVHDQNYNMMRHFEVGSNGVHMANTKSIPRRLLV